MKDDQQPPLVSWTLDAPRGVFTAFDHLLVDQLARKEGGTRERIPNLSLLLANPCLPGSASSLQSLDDPHMADIAILLGGDCFNLPAATLLASLPSTAFRLPKDC